MRLPAGCPCAASSSRGIPRSSTTSLRLVAVGDEHGLNDGLFLPSWGHGHEQGQRRGGSHASTRPGRFPDPLVESARKAPPRRRSPWTSAIQQSQALRVGECRPQVVDAGVVAALHADDAPTVNGSQRSRDAGVGCGSLRSCHPPPLSSGDFGVQGVRARLPQRSVGACRHSSTSASGSGRRLYTRNCASLRTSTRPASRRTRRCRQTPRTSDRQQCGQLTHGCGTVRAEHLQHGSAACVRQRLQHAVSMAYMYHIGYVPVKLHTESFGDWKPRANADAQPY